MKKVGLILIVLAIFAIPVIAFTAGTGIWKDTRCAAESTSGGPTGPCDLCDALIVVRNIVMFLFQVAIPIAVGMIVYGAIRLMVAAGSEEQVTKGRKTITSAVVGLAIVLGAWLIINTLLHVLTGNLNFPWNSLNCV